MCVYVCIYVYVMSRYECYITFISTKPEGEVLINVILHENITSGRDVTNIYRDGAIQLLCNAVNAHAQYHV